MHNSYNTAANFGHHNGGLLNYFYKAAFPGSASNNYDQNQQNRNNSNTRSGDSYNPSGDRYGNYEQKNNNNDKDQKGRKKG